MRTGRILAIFCLLALPLGAQTTTPNIGLEVPVTGGLNWQTQLNFNWNLLDTIIPARAQRSLNLSDLADLPTALANMLGNPPSGTYSIVCSSTTHCAPVTATTGADDGFPLTIGSTSVAAHSTTTAVAGFTVDGVTPTVFGFLDPTSSIQTQINGKQTSLGFTAVPNTRTVAGHALSADVAVNAADLAVGALPNGVTATTQAAGNASNLVATTNFVLGQGVGGRTVSISSDTISSTDHGHSVLYTATSAVALPDPSTVDISNFVFVASARSNPGIIVTFTAGAGTFLNSSGGTSTTLVMTSGQTCSISSPDNTNYLARCAAARHLANYTVSALPSASTVGIGAQALVTDASTFTVGTCTGGGSDPMIAVSNGSTWTCH